MMEILPRQCLEDEVIELKSLYGSSKTLQLISQIYSARYKHFNICLLTGIHEAVLNRLEAFSGRKRRLAQLLDDEQQRELEQELEEERQQKRPPPAHPYQPVLHPEIRSLCNMQSPSMDLAKFSLVFRPLSDAFLGTLFYRDCQADCWQKSLWITSEFNRVIETRGELLDSFLRPPRWIVVYQDKHIIFVSPYEAYWLMGQLHVLYRNQLSNEPLLTTLRLLLPRTKRDQSIFINTEALTMPPSTAMFSIPVRWLAELFVFNGTLYFGNSDEQTGYCQCLGVCPKLRTATEEETFENGWIAVDGYVEKIEHRCLLQLGQCRFCSNPLIFVRKLVENRNHTHAPLISHVGSIIFNGIKLTIS